MSHDTRSLCTHSCTKVCQLEQHDRPEDGRESSRMIAKSRVLLLQVASGVSKSSSWSFMHLVMEWRTVSNIRGRAARPTLHDRGQWAGSHNVPLGYILT